MQSKCFTYSSKKLASFVFGGYIWPTHSLRPHLAQPTCTCNGLVFFAAASVSIVSVGSGGSVKSTVINSSGFTRPNSISYSYNGKLIICCYYKCADILLFCAKVFNTLIAACGFSVARKFLSAGF